MMIPLDLVGEVFSFLPFTDFIAVSYVGRSWHAVQSSDYLWRKWMERFSLPIAVDRPVKEQFRLFTLPTLSAVKFHFCNKIDQLRVDKIVLQCWFAQNSAAQIQMELGSVEALLIRSKKRVREERIDVVCLARVFSGSTEDQLCRQGAFTEGRPAVITQIRLSEKEKALRKDVFALVKHVEDYFHGHS